MYIYVSLGPCGMAILAERMITLVRCMTGHAVATVKARSMRRLKPGDFLDAHMCQNILKVDRNSFEKAARICIEMYHKWLFLSQGFAESHAAKFCAEENLSETDTPTQVITLAFTGWTLR